MNVGYCPAKIEGLARCVAAWPGYHRHHRYSTAFKYQGIP
jgi:hypothetical protein